MRNYFNCHTHTIYSNLRGIDSINLPDQVIKKAIELGMSGIAFTDHESLSAHVIINKIATELQQTNPDFKIALGDEIYLTNTRDKGQVYYHFILIAKNALGHKCLREISSTAWYNSYYDNSVERVPTLKAELAETIKKYKGSVMATSACMGGELSANLLYYAKAQAVGDKRNATLYYNKVVDFITFCMDVFGNDFYIECAPGASQEQIMVNQKLLGVAKAYNIPLVVGTDAHYLTKEDRPVHKAYLNSKDEEREVDSFYEYTYLMDSDEVIRLLKYSYDDETIEWILDNTLKIQDKVEYYNLFHKQDVPSVEVKDYPKVEFSQLVHTTKEYPSLAKMTQSDDIQDRYWVSQCIEKLYNLDKMNETYLDELEEEARVKSVIGEKLETNMFRYPNTLQHYIDLIWDCGSIVGAGRGSSCAALNHYLLGITQLDPVEWNLPFFRYMNDERTELGDIDIDICPSKRPAILQKIKEERKHLLNDDLPAWAKDNLGCTLVATFGTEGTKSAIQTACRGYRSEEYPNGIDVDEALYMSALVPSERGFLWPIHDVVEGNEELNRQPIHEFIHEVNQYPGLLDIIEAIEGMINHRGSHASGVIFFDGDPFDKAAFMKTPSGDIITQYDLHDVEYCGAVKYDFLVTEVQDKLVQTIKFIQEDNQIEKDLSLRQIYDKYFHPNVLPLKDDAIWTALAEGTVLNTFQFDSIVGAQTAKKIKPQTIQEMSSANGLMRLMGEDGEERPLDKYVRQKQDISLWYKEMDRFGLTKAEQTVIEPYFKADYGVPPDQESLMLMLMDKDICDFSLKDANVARKIVGKKQMSKIPSLREQVLKQAKSEKLGQYIWKYGVGPQMGYSFSRIHALAYSFIGAQTLYIATHWNPIYWNTACLVVNSGALEDNSEEELVDIYEEESDRSEGTTFEDLPDRSGKVKKTASTDYGKLAKAIGEIMDAGISVSLVDINASSFSFEPDAKNNTILYGMKAMLNVGDDLIAETIKNRPYKSPKDYLERVHPNKQAMVSLIKGGAFDKMMDRTKCMVWYLWETCDKKSRLNLQNMPGLIKYDLLPKNTDEQKFAYVVYEFNRYLKTLPKNGTKYNLDTRAIDFLQKHDYESLIDSDLSISATAWDKIYQKQMDVFRTWIAKDKDSILDKLNQQIFKIDWDKYALGNLSSWEMEALCFYYHKHELADINKAKYGLSDFSTLPEEPIVAETKKRNGKTYNTFQLYRICGTCIAKNKTKGIVSLLTTEGVVNIKFRKEYFSLFDKQISERGADGVKHTKEKSWFNRGSMIIVQGFRSGDDFIVKKYANSTGHQLYKITKIVDNNNLILQTERYGGESDE